MSKTDRHLYPHPVPGVSVFTASPCVAVAFITKVTEFFLTLSVGQKSCFSPYFTIGEMTTVKFCDKIKSGNQLPKSQAIKSCLRCWLCVSDTEVPSKVRAPFSCSLVAPHGFSWNLWSEEPFAGMPLLNFTADKSWAHRVQKS